MNLQSLLSRPRARLVALLGAVLLVLVMGILLLRGCTGKEPTPEELRLQQIDWLVQLVEAYKERYGSYPQPTARTETSEGIRHVWGYEAKKPALASCTVALDGSGTALPKESRCGGGIYDVEGTLIGWKGTLTLESGLNTIEVADRGVGRVASPLSELVQSIPVDPAYAPLPDFTDVGFGEYVYAIRNPEAPGAEERQEYQIAATVRDPLTAEVRTLIRGNYFVRSEEQGRLPASLIGPGILFDRFGNPVPEQERPLQVLLDGQRQGFPNPVLGDGENILRTLMLERKFTRLFAAAEERSALLATMAGDDAAEAVRALSLLQERINGQQELLKGDEGVGTALPDLDALDAELEQDAADLTGTMQTFLHARAETIAAILTQETQEREKVLTILKDALTVSQQAEESVLLARDEALAYLAGSGIEEQARQRIARKIEGILKDLPDLSALFQSHNLLPMHPFLTEEQETVLNALREKEAASGSTVFPSGSGSTIFLTTIDTELSRHFTELSLIARDIFEDATKDDISIEEMDGALSKLSQALRTENARFSSLFEGLADVESVKTLQKNYDAIRGNDDVQAIRMAAERMQQRGDCTPFLFDQNLLTRTALERMPGFPDTDSVADDLLAEYQGIPYPLP